MFPEIINGIRYAKISSTKQDKIKSLKDKQYAFRHAKDREDLNRIKHFKRSKKW